MMEKVERCHPEAAQVPNFGLGSNFQDSLAQHREREREGWIAEKAR